MTAAHAALYREPAADAREWLTFTYTRLSKDPTGVRELHETQNREIDAVITRQNFPVPRPEHRFSDNDLSASKADVIRPDWERLLEALRAIDGRKYGVRIIGYKQDRLTRTEVTSLGDLIYAKRGELWTSKEGHIVVKPGGRLQFLVQGLFATQESETISLRSRDGIATAAMHGARHGETGYGWKRSYENFHGAGKPVAETVLIPEEAAIVEDAARRILNGEKLYSIAKDFTARGIPTPGAGKVLKRDPVTKEPVKVARDNGWTMLMVRQMLMREANIGVRVHVAGSGPDAVTTRYPAAWEPILDDDVYRRVRQVLTAPERRSTTRGTDPRHLLSGIASCGICGGVLYARLTMRVRTRDENGKRRVINSPTYFCRNHHVQRSEALVDAEVVEAVIEMFSSPEILRNLGRGENHELARAREREAAILARKNEMVDMFAAGEMDRAAYTRAMERINAQLAEVEAVTRADRDSQVWGALIGVEDVRAAWNALPLDRQRSIIAATVTVHIDPADKSRRGFDAAAVRVTPKGLRSVTA